MIASLRDTTLSAAILDAVRAILPYTAEGQAMPAAVAHEVVTQLSATLKFATLLEQELAVHRFEEAGLSARAMVEREVMTALDEELVSSVVRIDFEGGRKQ